MSCATSCLLRLRLGDHWHDADLVRELPYDLDVEGFDSVAVGVDEVEAAVDAVVDDVLAVEAAGRSRRGGSARTARRCSG